MKVSRVVLSACIVPCLLQPSVFASESRGPAGTTPGSALISIPFVENHGQAKPEIAYYGRASGGTVSVTHSGELLLALPAAGATESVLTVREILRASGRSDVTGQQRTMTSVSSYVGRDPTRWMSNLPTYDSVSLGEVWPGIHLRLAMRSRAVEKILTLSPGADPSRIRIGVEGIEALEIRDDGGLTARIPGGEVQLTAPRAWQTREDVRRPVQVSYLVEGTDYGFTLGEYDPELALVIDPLISATYLGGCGSEDTRVIAVNSLPGHPNAGDVYVAGTTTSSDFGAACLPADTDTFVARFDRELDRLDDVIFLGSPAGTDIPIALTIAPDGHPMAGSIVLLGEPDNAADFPGSGFGSGGNDDLFLAILAPDLTLRMASHLGGAIHDRPGALAIHPSSGDIYVSGETNSDDFPGTEGGAQAAHGGIFDAFVARFSIDFTSAPSEPPMNLSLVLEQSTYLGGRTGSEVETVLAFDASAGVYIKGRTNSRDLPVTMGAPQSTPGGGIEDLFVSLLTTDLTRFQTVTYLGGNGIEETRDSRLVVQAGSGNVHLAGTTRSDNEHAGIKWSRGGFIARFSRLLSTLETVVLEPVSGVTDLLEHPSGELYLLGTVLPESFTQERTADAAQPGYGGGPRDAFVALYDSQLNPVRATYLGGDGSDSGLRFGVHPMSEDIYVAGTTGSTDLPFSRQGAQPMIAGKVDGFVARLSPDLTAASTNQATYFGGSEDDAILALSLPDFDRLYVGGRTVSENLPTTVGSPQPDFGGGNNDGFLASFTLDLTAALPSCVGDCDGDGKVLVNEIIFGVHIALGQRPVGDCTSIDSDGDGEVRINELIEAVNRGVQGCA